MPSAYRPDINARAYSTAQLATRLTRLLADRAAKYNAVSAERWQETDRIVTELKRRWAAPKLCLQARLLGPEVRQTRRPAVRCTYRPLA